ncbi:MAG: DMT family transporter [Bacteroidetes bacterium]|nr:MAG: DMT family transporter [Bacteroidota bacterium]
MKQPDLNTPPVPPLAWILLGLLSLTWGSSYILIKKSLIAFTPQQLAGLRISISAVAFFPVFLWNIRQVVWSKWKAFALVGFAGSFFPAFLYATAQTVLNSSVTGVLSALTPIFTLLLGILYFRFPVSRGKMIGVFVGFLGAAFLVLPDNPSTQSADLMYALLAVLATFLYALTNNVLKAALHDVSPVVVSATSFMFIALPAFIALYTSDFTTTLTHHPHGWKSLGYVTILSLFSTFMATLFYFKLVQLTNPVFASMVSYLVPIIALLWGLGDGESVVPLQVVGMVLILVGIYFSRMEPGQPKS